MGLISLLLVSCSLADPELFRALEGDGGTNDAGDIDATVDGGVDTGGDAGPTTVAVDRCGDEDVLVLLDSTPDIDINTRGLTNRIGSLGGCGNLGVPGNDGFLAVDVLEGEEWHFHLRVHPEEDVEAVLNPTLYVLNSSCAGGACSPNLLANFCEARGEEHFAFTFDTSGRFYIGIDDTNPGGGRYLLDAIQPVCGNATPEHGEACEGAADCSSQCRFMLSEASLQEKGFNFNFKEANEIILPSPSNTLTIRGDVGGLEGCFYPDVFAIDVPDNNTLTVEQLDADGSACTGAGAASISLEIRNGSDALLASSGDPVNGCVSVSEDFTRGGIIYVKLNDEREIDLDRPFVYQLRFSVRP